MWESLWSEARYDFRLSEAEFRALTPRQLTLLRKRRAIEHERYEFLLGILNQTTANFSMSRPTVPVRAVDFMPSRWARPESDEDRLWRLHEEIMAGGAILAR